VFKAHRLLYHSTLGLRVIKKKKGSGAAACTRPLSPANSEHIRQPGPDSGLSFQVAVYVVPSSLGGGTRARLASVRVRERFRGRLVCKAHRRLYHSTLGLRVIKKKRRVREQQRARADSNSLPFFFFFFTTLKRRVE